jgi:hypothetical protein
VQGAIYFSRFLSDYWCHFLILCWIFDEAFSMKIIHSIKWVVLALTLLTLEMALNMTGEAQDLPGDQTKPAPTSELSNPQSSRINGNQGIQIGRQVELQDGMATIEPDGLRVKVTRERTYLDFLSSTGALDLAIDQKLAEGEKPPTAKQQFQKRVQVSPEGDETIHSIADDTFRKLNAIEKKYEADLYSFRQSSPEEWKVKEEASWEERVAARDAAIEDAMTRLRQQLTEDYFRKIDAYIYQQGHGGREIIYHYAPISAKDKKDVQPDASSTLP